MFKLFNLIAALLILVCQQVYELERDRDIQATALQAAHGAMEKARKHASDIERQNKELERSLAAKDTEQGRLTMENASLQNKVQRLQQKLTENLKTLSAASLSASVYNKSEAPQQRTPGHIRAAENESRQQTLEEMTRLREQVRDLTTRLATRNNINSGLEVTERAALQQQLESMRATAMQQQVTSTARVRDLEQGLAVAEARLEGLRHERDNALADVSKLRVEWKELHIQLAKARVKAGNEMDGRKRAEIECENLRRQLEAVDPSQSALEESRLTLLQRDREFSGGADMTKSSPIRHKMKTYNGASMSPQQALVLSEERNALLRRRANEAEVKAKTVERVLQRMISESPHL